MYIHLNCQACSQRIRVPETHAGKRVRCPVCKGVSAIPATQNSQVPAEVEAPTVVPKPTPTKSASTASHNTFEGDSEDEVGTPPDLADDEEEQKGVVGFHMSVDTTQAVVSLTLMRGLDVLVDEAQVRDRLIKEGVKKGIDSNQIKMACLHLAYPDQAEIGREFIIAEGVSPTPGIDGHLDFVVDVTGEAKIDLEQDGADEDRRVDFKNMAKITTVKAGQLLAHLVEPVTGVPGIGLDGEPIHAEDPVPAVYSLAEGVALSPDGKEIRAAIDGRPIWSEGVLAVLQVYEIPGNVDFGTGNIDFDGHVIIRGAVLDEFEIRCKSLEVDGTVGSATVITTQDATFKGGVNGHHKGRLLIGGNCIAKYFNEVYGAISGDLAVERGITNCEVGVLGELRAERIVGGDSAALLGFEVNYLGSDLGVVTTVRPAVDYRVAKAESDLEAMDEQIEELGKKAGPYLAQGAEFDRLPEEKQQASEAAFEQLTQSRLKRKQMAQSLDVNRQAQAELGIGMVNIGSQLHADVVVCIDDVSREFTEAMGGKWTIAKDAEGGQIEIDKYRRRPVKRSG